MADLSDITAGHADALARLHALAFDRPWSAAEFASLIGHGAGGLVTADAFILVRTMAGEAEILTLATAPAARRQGLARQLVETVSRNIGAEALFLEVAVDNAAAIGLYQQAGFERAGLRRNYYLRPGGAVDALVLRKTLSSPA